MDVADCDFGFFHVIKLRWQIDILFFIHPYEMGNIPKYDFFLKD